MGSSKYWLFEIGFIPVLLTFFFIFSFLFSFFQQPQKMLNNPHTKKTVKKYQYTHTNQNIFCVTLLTSCVSVAFFLNNLGHQNIRMMFFLLFLLVAVLKTANYFSYKNSSIQSNNAFLGLMLPALLVVLQTNNFFVFVLSFEVLSFLVYFVFFEMAFMATNNTKNVKLNVIIQNLLYFFWLSFLGSVLLILTLVGVLACTNSFCYETLKLAKDKQMFTFVSVCLFSSLSLKLGGLFFFTFKAELYKLLNYKGVYILSVFIGITYFIILTHLTVVLPVLSTQLRYLTAGSFFIFTFWLIASTTLKITNIQLFCAISTVLTFFFAILCVV